MRILGFVLGLALLTSTATADELLTNGGFEDGNFNGWTLGGGAVQTVEMSDAGGAVTPIEGNFMASMADPVGLLNGSLSQTVSVAGASALEIGFSIRLRGTDIIPFIDTGVDVIFVRLNGNIIDALSLDDAFDTVPGPFGSTLPGLTPDDTGWQTTNFNVGPPLAPGLNNVTIEFDFRNGILAGGDTGQLTTAYVDAVSINAIPEPVSVALFGAAAAAIAFRVRRRRN